MHTPRRCGTVRVAPPACPRDYHAALSSNPSQPDATILMNAAASGDKAAADQLLPLVYAQLRQAAQLGMAAERQGHTLSATALVHEAYLKLVGPRQVPWSGRAHFYTAAAEAMRRVLLDHAKSRGREKRGGNAESGRGPRAFASVADLAIAEDSEEILSFDAALRRLETELPEAARVVQLRFYAGLSVEQAAHVLEVSERTVGRLWLFARAWLHRAVREAERED
jgi:RNA polymerase sigma factor (TIGR02999 family)